jgi:hypothetical protein
MPVKGPHTRRKPLALALASGHGRYVTVAPERTLLSVWEWPLRNISDSNLYVSDLPHRSKIDPQRILHTLLLYYTSSFLEAPAEILNHF